jgi:hypothetical protein
MDTSRVSFWGLAAMLFVVAGALYANPLND